MNRYGMMKRLQPQSLRILALLRYHSTTSTIDNSNTNTMCTNMNSNEKEKKSSCCCSSSSLSSLSLSSMGVNIASIQCSNEKTVVMRETTMRGRMEASRIRGKLAFLHLRQPPFHSIQVVATGKSLIQTIKTITPESIIEVTGIIKPADRPITSTSCANYELHAEDIKLLSRAATPLPFPLRDYNTKLDTRLNHRTIDMRTPLTASMMRIVSIISQNFRHELLSRDFIEIHTPKLIGTASEGGSAVFGLDYFGQSAYLAQSPQLYKQMSIMGDAMRVFEIGPVFRAEKSLTHRHLTEFIGLDAEFVIKHDYTEVLDILEATMCGMIHHMQTEHITLLQQVQESLAKIDVGDDIKNNTNNNSINKEEEEEEEKAKQGGISRRYVNSPIICEVSPETIDTYSLTIDDGTTKTKTTETTTKRVETTSSSVDAYHARIGCGPCKVLRLAFDDAVQLLHDHGECTPPITDFTLPQERRLGELVWERYGVDVYIVDQFPSSARPFYTMPHPIKEGVTCSFDMYIRGEEICSGAQRVHDPILLLQQITQQGKDAADMKDYVDAFRYGAWPHGGFGLGLERIVLFLVGAKDIRQVSLFPRDPKRLTP